MVRALARFFIAVVIGVGATLAWQSHGEELVGTWAPSLAWLLPVSMKSPPDGQASAAAVVSSAELVQQLKPVAIDLAIVRHGIDQIATAVKQLAVKQEQMSQDIATLQATEQDIRQKISPPSQSRTVTPRKQSSSAPPEPPSSGPPMRLLDGPAQSAR